MDQSSTITSCLVDIIADPKKSLRAVGQNKKWLWMPLILLIVIPISVTLYYFNTVDFDWLVDHIFASLDKDVPDEARDFMTRGMMISTTVASQVIFVPALLTLYGLYLHLVEKLSTSDERGFMSWFSLSVWTSFPSVLASVAMMIYYLTAGNNQVGFDELSFFSLNSLVTHYPMGHSAMSFMSSLTPFTAWNIGLVALGLMLWTKRTFLNSLIIATLPYAVVYGIWGFIAFG